MTTAAPKERLAFLDVARGLAALLVVLQHGLDATLPGFHQWSFGFFSAGRVGVVLFLVISGFIIPFSLEQGGSNSRFWLRRFFRLFPLYWLSIALGFASVLAGTASGLVMPLNDRGDWLLNLTMLQGFFNRPSVWGVFWTLQLELVIYAGCSLLHALRLSRHSVGIVAAAFVGYALFGMAQPFLTGHGFSVSGGRYLYFAPLIGLLAQRYWQGRLRGRTLLALLGGHALTLPVIWWVNNALYPADVTIDCLRELALDWGTACGCFFLLLAARRMEMPAALRRLGVISYSVYVLHLFVLSLLPSDWPVWVHLPCLLAGSAVLSELTYRSVEAPGIALGRIVERRLFRPVSPRPDGLAAPERRAA